MKLRQFQSFLSKEKIDAAILFHPDTHITYFSRMVPSHAIMVITPRTADLYLSKLDLPPHVTGIRNKNLSKEWEKEIKNSSYKTIGINKGSLSVQQLEKLQQIFPKAAWKDVGETITYLRTIKTAKEIEYTEKACTITSEAFAALVKELPKRTLKTEQDVALFLEKYMKNAGAQLAFPTIVGSDVNSSIPHHVTSNSLLKKGFLQLDFGARWKNYCADMSRVIYLGKASPSELSSYAQLLSVQEQCINDVRENKLYKELDHLARKMLGKDAKYFIHGLGHGVGIDIHETPVYTNATVQQGHVFTIEPGVYFPNKFGLRIEDTLVFNGKVTVLTTASKRLVEIQ
ncbi:MAG TPA: M24 family metallopeptidase [Candidatus Nanoarchaeia archaeon]|nr:M24 family metallopeptidase [Candidatus Nanoarchaeia archaeon]